MWRILAYVGAGLAALVLIAAVGVAAYLYSLTVDLPDHQSLATYEPPVTTRVYAGDGSLIGEFARERRIFVPIDMVPERIKQAFLSAEDKNFYSHPGVDISGIIRAAIENISNYMAGRRLEGASTITQQVARNFLLSNEQTVHRKVKEALISMRLESAFSKDKILELYLNEIFLGQNSYGVAAAALTYFDRSLDQLTIAQAAYLAALPKAPSNYHPVRHRERALGRRNWAIGQMYENGYITEEERDAAVQEPLEMVGRPMGAMTADHEFFVEEVRREVRDRYGEKGLLDGGLSVRSTLDTRMQSAAVRALRAGLIGYDRRHGWRGPVAAIELGEGWEARLEAVPKLADVTEWKLAVVVGTDDQAAGIAFADGARGQVPMSAMTWARPYISANSRGPEPQVPGDILKLGDVIYVLPVAATAEMPAHHALMQVPDVNGAIVALDPHTGRIKALVGGFSYYGSEFSRATQAQRQPGSAFKPFIYAAALDRGYTPSSKVLDGPFCAPQGPGLPMWCPANYTDKFGGPTTLRVGLEKSFNLMTVRLAADVGMQTVAEYTRRFGVQDDLPPFLSSALGAGSTTPLKLTYGYAKFVNGGKQILPTLIDRVQDRHGATVFRRDERACQGCNADGWTGQSEPLVIDNREQIADPRTSFQIVSMLEGVIQRGTATRLKDLPWVLSGKTGTSNDWKDAWFIGFTPDLVVGVFVGFDQPRTMGRDEAGGKLAVPIFKDFIQVALEGVPPAPFRAPPGITMFPIVASNGAPASARIDADGTVSLPPGVILEAYKSGTEPGAASMDTGPIQFQSTASETETDATREVQTGSGGLY